MFRVTDTSKANPHAATTINGVTNTYDNNGNLTSDGTRTFTWNYDNTIASTTQSGVNSRYVYDYQNQRTSLFNGSATTTYAGKYYTITGATTTRNIYAGNELIAMVEGNGTATTSRYVHTDHLGGTHVLTSASTTEVQALDYYPFGTIRINSKAAAIDSPRKFTGYEYDTATDLNYAFMNTQIDKYHHMYADEIRAKTGVVNPSWFSQ